MKVNHIQERFHLANINVTLDNGEEVEALIGFNEKDHWVECVKHDLMVLSTGHSYMLEVLLAFHDGAFKDVLKQQHKEVFGGE